MSQLTLPAHLDEWTLLRHVVEELEPEERLEADLHMEACARCRRTLEEMTEVHRQIRILVGDGEWTELPQTDPFARRPRKWEPSVRATRQWAEFLAANAVAASERGMSRAEELEPSPEASLERLRSFVASLAFSDPADRFALLYALQSSGHQIAENPAASRALAQEALRRLEGTSGGRAEAERLVPLGLIVGHAHLLVGQSGNFTGDYDEAGRHFAEAYRLFGESTADPFTLAQAEYGESQRRSFTGRAAQGLELARRARLAFDALDLEDYAARARNVEGIALYFLGRPEEALTHFRTAVEVFERQELWSNYASAINGLAECLIQLGRFDEARTQFARSLRRVAREKQPVWIAYIRHGLANAMFAAGRYREAAAAFGRAARLNRELGLLAIALTAGLYEVESWARSGDIARAAHRFELWREEIQRHGGIDLSLAHSLEQALAGEDLATVAALRQEAEGLVRERLKEKRIS